MVYMILEICTMLHILGLYGPSYFISSSAPARSKFKDSKHVRKDRPLRPCFTTEICANASAYWNSKL